VKFLTSNFYNISLFTVYETLLKKEFAQNYFKTSTPSLTEHFHSKFLALTADILLIPSTPDYYSNKFC